MSTFGTVAVVGLLGVALVLLALRILIRLDPGEPPSPLKARVALVLAFILRTRTHRGRREELDA